MSLYRNRTFRAALLAFGRLLTTIAMLIVAAVLSRMLDGQSYAAYRQTFMVFNFLAPLLVLGLPESLYYFIPREPHRSRQLLSTNVGLLGFSGVVFIVLVWLGGSVFVADVFHNNVLSELLLIFSPYPLLVLPLRSIDAVLVATNKIRQLTVFNIINRLLLLFGVVGGVMIFGTVQAAIAGAVISAVVALIPGLWLMYSAAHEGPWYPELSSAQAQLRFSGPLALASIIGMISINLDKLLVSVTDTPEAFAVYANGAMQIPLVGIITGAVTAVMLSEFASWYKEGDYARILVVWKSAMVKVAQIIFPTGVFLMGAAPEFMVVLFSERYLESYIPFTVYLFMLPVRITTFGAVIMAAGRNYVFVVHTGVSLLCNLVLSLVLIHFLGGVGAAISTVLLIYFWTIPFHVYHIQDILGVGLRDVFPVRELVVTGVLSLLAGAVFLVKPWLSSVSALVSLVVLAVAYGSVFGLLYLRFGVVPLPELTQWFGQRLRRKQD